ncbi:MULTISPECIES: Bug family tripartite tricarboxylate transporter substrate binding protein [Achromobacter]|uniref:Argininosuccinate lyase n=1 Tax=Achromobacter aegrifaciens TaxID=1287736 RepID=A0AAD2IZJ0_ACHAE|nr:MULTISPECIES: tripartite tricarboxylate transporter substrate binding protein [Achromobacter]MBD9380455.1 tripartite tricarboxylate transporter substrate binding protein [Achromobacter sp. ACM02]MBD9418829.1 tripartite tricarboxylate transporter substrate binding protein [Achromobacter sp. ACM04]MBD9429216.1 tripartite tricarboxylate transporter substrate binding protein [Achromobacter sp. ACM03]MDQ1760553.1 tripartite tricarboxylate transporter substrate binding protein [Achromobacter aegri
MRIITAAVCSALTLAALAAAPASAQDAPVRFIVPYPPGGAADQIARLVAQEMSKGGGATIIVENKPGAAGMIAADYVARAKPDGKTFFVGSNAPLVVNQALYAKMTYDPSKDFVPVSGMAKSPLLLVVRHDLPARDVKALIALGKQSPGKLTMGSAGTGNITYLAGEYAVSKLGFQVTHVPYQGSAPAIVGLMGSSTDMMFDALPSSMTQAQSGKIRPFAVLDDKRFAGLPDVPTAAELGYPGIDASAWFGLVAPAGTQTAVVDQMNRGVNQALAQPELQRKLTSIGAVAMPGDAQVFAAFVQAERDRWLPVARDLGLKAQ